MAEVCIVRMGYNIIDTVGQYIGVRGAVPLGFMIISGKRDGASRFHPCTCMKQVVRTNHAQVVAAKYMCDCCILTPHPINPFLTRACRLS